GLLGSIDARIAAMQAVHPGAAAQPPAPQGAQSTQPPGGAPLLPTQPVPPAPVDPTIVTIAELQGLRTAVAAATDDATLDAATAPGVTLYSTKAPAERERFDGWVRDFGGVEGGGTMATFLHLTDGQVASIMADYSVGGLAQQMLMGTFESNWFKAKECLVFW